MQFGCLVVSAISSREWDTNSWQEEGGCCLQNLKWNQSKANICWTFLDTNRILNEHRYPTDSPETATVHSPVIGLFGHFMWLMLITFSSTSEFLSSGQRIGASSPATHHSSPQYKFGEITALTTSQVCPQSSSLQKVSLALLHVSVFSGNVTEALLLELLRKLTVLYGGFWSVDVIKMFA